MSPQFKKFILVLSSLGLAVVTFKLLLLVFGDSNNGNTFFPMKELLYAIISLFSTSIYYRLLKKKFL